MGGIKKEDLINPNTWEEVADFARGAGVAAR